MQKLFIIITLLLWQQAAQAGIFIKLNLADTIACKKVMTSLSNIETVERFQIVFPENLQEQEAQLKTQLQVGDFAKATLLFNTSFYNYLHGKNQVSSLFYINSKGTIVYQTFLASFRPEAVQYYTRYSDKVVSQLHNENVSRRGEATHGDFTFYYFVDGIRKNFLIDLKNGIKYDLSFADTLVERFYKKIFGKRFTNRWPGIKEYIQDNKGSQPVMWHVRQMHNSNDVLAFVLVYDTIAKAKDEEIIFQELLLVKYNLATKQFGDVYMPSDKKVLSNKNVFPIQIEYINDKLYVLFSNNDKGTSDYVYCQINFDEQHKTFSKTTTCLPTCYPYGYLKKISSLYSQLFVNDGRAIVYAFADSLYDFGLKKFIKIPLPTSPVGQHIEHEIIGLRYNLVTTNYHIIYHPKEKNELSLLVFTNTGEVILNEKIAVDHGDLISPYQMLRYDKTKEQYRILDL